MTQNRSSLDLGFCQSTIESNVYDDRRQYTTHTTCWRSRPSSQRSQRSLVSDAEMKDLGFRHSSLSVKSRGLSVSTGGKHRSLGNPRRPKEKFRSSVFPRGRHLTTPPRDRRGSACLWATQKQAPVAVVSARGRPTTFKPATASRPNTVSILS